MAEFTSVSVRNFKNGKIDKDWGGVQDDRQLNVGKWDADNYVLCIKFQNSKPMDAIALVLTNNLLFDNLPTLSYKFTTSEDDSLNNATSETIGEGTIKATYRLQYETNTFVIPKKLNTGTHYLYIWTSNSKTYNYIPIRFYKFKYGGTSGTNTSGSDITYVCGESGSVYISNGNSFDNYEIFISNGTTWDRYMPHIYNGSSWEIYGFSRTPSTYYFDGNEYTDITGGWVTDVSYGSITKNEDNIAISLTGQYSGTYYGSTYGGIITSKPVDLTDIKTITINDDFIVSLNRSSVCLGISRCPIKSINNMRDKENIRTDEWESPDEAGCVLDVSEAFGHYYIFVGCAVQSYTQSFIELKITSIKGSHK